MALKRPKKSKNRIGEAISRRAQGKSFRKATGKLRKKKRASRLLSAGEKQATAFGKERRSAQKRLFKSLLAQGR